MTARALVALGLALTACGGSSAPRRAATPTPAPSESPARADTPAPRLTGARRCPGLPAATCTTLRVPLDRTGRDPGTLRLRVASAGPRDAPVLVLLSGGPGQPGLEFLPRPLSWLGADARGWRIVTLDQRGTGAGALRCPALQRVMGASDLTPPPRAAVRACAAALGGRRAHFATADTVADLEALRVALGARRLTLDGISYGTYVAERYALAHPDRVARLVLDSVVPHRGVSVFSEVSMRAAARVLGRAAAADLRTVVRRRHDGPALLDLLTSLSIGTPRLAGGIAALRDAARGDDAPLDGLARTVHRIVGAYPASQLSQGLHASTLCADTRAPWGDARAPLAGRRAALDAAAAELGDLGPFDRATATGNGIALQCLYWPPAPVAAPAPGGELPPVPVLLLAGDRDLSTPLEWARAEARTAPRGRLVVVRGAGHSVQSQGGAGLRALRRFLRR